MDRNGSRKRAVWTRLESWRFGHNKAVGRSDNAPLLERSPGELSQGRGHATGNSSCAISDVKRPRLASPLSKRRE